ncbi:DNA repair protein RadC [Lamprobacter modestohalophilus]|uniref:DNA repair protein RadC n=2 Tax=Lamprobacter modestohalophilus TaxID=1064514 RepID=A0A9X0W7V0_9GAMM|nr:DNA repair protein RadC [Lamprobacter modestohalophilus]MBK1618593.1 DNA repair protein RadC [Lamprobacter modestohalophilus]
MQKRPPMASPWLNDPLRRSALPEHEAQLVAEAIRCLEARYQVAGECLNSPELTREYLKLRLYGLAYEVFAVIYLNSRNQVIQYRELFRGTINGASVHPREVVRECLHWNASSVILAHNHPSGVAEPSQADLCITKRLQEALGLIDVQVLDHLVIGDGAGVSFAERGLL